MVNITELRVREGVRGGVRDLVLNIRDRLRTLDCRELRCRCDSGDNGGGSRDGVRVFSLLVLNPR